MIRLQITRVELTNHGPFRGTHRFDFSDAPVAVLLQPNESGKTTLLEAIPLILWGETAAEVTTQRNWSCGDREAHQGVLEFLRIEDHTVRHMRVRRDFDTHELIALELEGGATRKEIFRGKHNPSGRTQDHRRWPDHVLPKLWAPVTWQGFRHLAMLTQPIPDQLSHQCVQELIAGTGSSTYDQAKEQLVTRYRRLSKHSANAGLSDRDAKNAGELENLETQRSDLIRDLDATRANLERTVQLREEIAALEGQEGQLEQERRVAEAALDMIKRIRDLTRDYDGAVKQSGQLKEALAQANVAQEAVRVASRELDGLPPEVPALTVERIGELRKLLEGYRLQRATLIDPAVLEEAWTNLHQRYADVRDWPDSALESVERLRVACGDRDQAQAEVARLTREVEAACPQPDPGRRARRALVAGLVFSVAVMALVGAAVSWGWGLAAGIMAGTVLGSIVYAAYRPMRPHPAHAELVRELETARANLATRVQAVQSAYAALNWTDETDLARLAHFAARRNALREQVDDLRAQKSKQDELRAAIDPANLPAPLPQVLATCSGDVDQASAVLHKAQTARQNLSGAQATLTAVLRPFQVANVAELEAKHQREKDGRVSRCGQIDQLARESPVAEELGRLSAEAIDARKGELENTIEGLKKKLRTNQDDQFTARKELADMPSLTLNAAQGETRVHELEREIEQIKVCCRAIGRAYSLLGEATEAFSSRHCEAIAGWITDQMATWTQLTDRQFHLASDFRLGMTVCDRNGVQQDVSLSVLSQGTKDQLALAARIAVMGRVGAEVLLPLLIDDALLTWDPSRRERLLPALQASAQRRQIILVSHDPAFAAWGAPVRHTEVPL